MVWRPAAEATHLEIHVSGVYDGDALLMLHIEDALGWRVPRYHRHEHGEGQHVLADEKAPYVFDARSGYRTFRLVPPLPLGIVPVLTGGGPECDVRVLVWEFHHIPGAAPPVVTPATPPEPVPAPIAPQPTLAELLADVPERVMIELPESDRVPGAPGHPP